MTSYPLFGVANPPDSLTSSNNFSPAAFSLGTEFGVTSTCWITAIRYYKNTTTNNFGTIACRLYSVNTATTGTFVTGTDVSITSTTAQGWLSANLTTPVQLNPGTHYRVAGLFPTRYTAFNNYWNTGPGASDIVNGPLTAYSNAHATGGIQGSFVAQSTGTTPNFPTSLGSNSNYYVDVVVTDVNPFIVPETGSDTAALTESSSVSSTQTTTDTASVTETVSSTATIPVSDSASVTETAKQTLPVSDSSTVTETPAVSSTQTVTDTATTTDHASLNIIVTDTATTTDAVSTIGVTGSDSATVTESTSLFQGLILSSSDSATATDGATYTATITASDSATVTETASASDSGAQNDSATVTETAHISSTLSSSDTAAVTEANAPINSNTQVPVSDSFAATDTSSILATPATTDTAHVVDTPAISSTNTQPDTAVVTETAKLNQTRTDTATVTETAKISLNLSDSATVTETSETTEAGTDSATVTEGYHLNILASDSALVTDTAISFADVEQTDTFTVVETSEALIPRAADDEFAVTETAITNPLPTFFEDNIYYPGGGYSNRNFRVIAQDHFTRQFIHWDLPLDNVQVIYTFNGPNILSGELSSEMESIMSLDPPLIPDRTWLHLEEDNEIRGSFILTPFIDDPQTQTRTIEAEGFSTYPSWIVYQGDSFTGVQVDPADMIRMIWDHVQSYTDGNLGVQISQTKTPVKLGEPPEAIAFTTSEGVSVNFSAGPYTLNYWSVTNCGDEINNLCVQTPIDFLEYSYWNATKSDVIHKISLGYPRVGTKRNDLSFREGENLSMLIPSYQGSNDNYASDVIVIGAGTGPGSIRAISSGRIGLLRKTNVIQNQDITNTALAQSLADFEFKRIAHSRFLIENITVDLTHPNSLWGSFAPGDDILVEATVDYVGYIQDWYRITSYQYDPYYKTAIISLSPSDSFSYGAENIDPYDQLPTAGFATLATQQDFSQLLATDVSTRNLSELQAYVTQNIQQQLCTYFNKNSLNNGMCLYWYWDSMTPVGTAQLPTVKWNNGPLSDLSTVLNFMIIGKTDYGHILTGDNIILIATDGTIGQTQNATSDQVYPNPYYVPDPTNTDTTPPTPSEIQQAAALILTRIEANLPINIDFSWTGEPFIVSQYNDTLYEKFLGYSNMGSIQFLAGIVYGQIQ